MNTNCGPCNTIDTKLLATEIALILDKHLNNHISKYNETEALLLQLPIIKELIKENSDLKKKLENANNVTLQINEISDNTNVAISSFSCEEDIKDEAEDDEAEDDEAEDDEAEDDEAEDDEAEDDEAEEEDDEVEEEDDEVEEEDDEEEVIEIEIDNKIYFTTNEINGKIFSQDLDGDVGEQVGNYKNGKPIFN